MTIFQVNRKRQHKFLISWALFGFCMARILTCVMRIVWATKPDDTQISITAQILNNAGVLVVYLINLLFAQRILRAMHPKIGWHALLSHTLHVAYALIAAMLVMVITATVISYYTLDMQTRLACATCLKVAICFLFIITVSPLILLAIAFALPRDRAAEEEFGHGSIETMALLVLLSTCLTIIIAGFKLGTVFQPPRPKSAPAWFDSRAAFYCFGFLLEITILVIFQLARVDKRFHVPNGSSKVKSYQAPERSGKEVRESMENV